MIDLHQHTNISDGSCSIEETINLSKARGLNLISITDHDTLDSQFIASEHSRSLGMDYIYGVEISTMFNNMSVHVLGYFSKYPSPEVSQYIKNQRIISTIKNMRLKSRQTLMGYYELKDTVELIHRNNGVAILAHPIVYHEVLDKLLPSLDGAECVSPYHDEKFTRLIIDKCTNAGLFCTAGTDFHEIKILEKYNELCGKYYNYIDPFVRMIRN